jgi:NitT/TauT family transport system permease protein
MRVRLNYASPEATRGGRPATGGGHRRGPSPAWKPRATRWGRGLAGLAIILLLAQALGSSGVLSRSVLPLASTVLARAVALAGSAQFRTDLAATVESWALGLGIAVAVAVPCGLLLGNVPVVRSATRSLVEFLRPVPAVVLIPLVALLIGPGLQMSVTLIAYAAIWPILLNTIYGLDDVDPLAKETLTAFGFGRMAVIRRVCLPSAAPFIVTGIRLASSIAIIVAIGTGVVTGRIDGNGIGAYIADATTSSPNTAVVLAAALWAGLLGLALNALITWAGRRALPWHHGYLGEPG